MDINECCLITNGRCPYEINNKCTSICGGEKPYGNPLCEIEDLEYKHQEDFKITEDDMKKFLTEFHKAIKNKY